MIIYGIIYLIRNKVDNKIYIGQTCNVKGFVGRYYYKGSNIEKVYNYHLSNKNNSRYYNSHLLNSIEKYGVESFEIDEEFDVAYSKEELDKLEDMYIKIYNTTNREFGYNKKFGGSSNKLTEETKVKIGEKAKLRLGNLNHFYGKIHTEETKNKIREKQVGKKYSNEINMKKGKKGESHHNSKKIICITTGVIFSCQSEAGKFYNIKSTSHITSVCQGKRNYCGKLEDGTKLIWMYYDEYLLNEESCKSA